MATRWAAGVALTELERVELTRRSRSGSVPPQRAAIVLLAADGLSNTAIAAQVGVSRPTVIQWRRRFLMGGIDGLGDQLRPGRPPSRPAGIDVTSGPATGHGLPVWPVRFAVDRDVGAALPQLLTGPSGQVLAEQLLPLLWPAQDGRMDTPAAAEAFHVLRSTLHRWRRQGFPAPRAQQLAALLTPTPESLLREQLEEQHASATLRRLGRSWGRRPQIPPGWLKPHRVFIAHRDGTPLDCVVITREGAVIAEARRGVTADGSNFYFAHNRFHAQLIRAAVLRLPQHARARVQLPGDVAGNNHNATWLTAQTSISSMEWLAIAAHTAQPT